MHSRRGGGWSLEYDDIRRTYSPRVKGRGSPRFNAMSSRYKRRVVLVAALLASDFAPTVTLFAPDIALPGTFAASVDVFRQPPRPQTFLARSTDTRQAFAQLREARASRRSVFVRAFPSGTVNTNATRQYTTRLASIIPAIDLGGTLSIGEAAAVSRICSAACRPGVPKHGRSLPGRIGTMQPNRPDRHPRHSSPCRGGMCHILPECRSALGQRLTWRPWPGSWRTRRRGWPGPCR